MERAFFVGAIVCLSTEVIAPVLPLVGRQAFLANAVVVGQRARERWHWNAELRRSHNDVAPGFLGLCSRFLEIRSEQQVFQVRIGIERFFDVFQKASANNTAATPE